MPAQPIPHSLPPVCSTVVTNEDRERETTCNGEMWKGMGKEPNGESYYRQKVWSSINHSILSGWGVSQGAKCFSEFFVSARSNWHGSWPHRLEFGDFSLSNSNEHKLRDLCILVHEQRRATRLYISKISKKILKGTFCSLHEDVHDLLYKTKICVKHCFLFFGIYRRLFHIMSEWFCSISLMYSISRDA
jgi:hypothetical protein